MQSWPPKHFVSKIFLAKFFIRIFYTIISVQISSMPASEKFSRTLEGRLRGRLSLKIHDDFEEPLTLQIWPMYRKMENAPKIGQKMSIPESMAFLIAKNPAVLRDLMMIFI